MDGQIGRWTQDETGQQGQTNCHQPKDTQTDKIWKIE